MVGGHAGDGTQMKGRLLDAVPLTTLSGVGASQAGKLAKIGLETIQDLLLHLPLRYEDRTRLYPINDLQPGIFATVEGEVLRTDISFGRRRMLNLPDQRRYRPAHPAFLQFQRRDEKQPGHRPSRDRLR